MSLALQDLIEKLETKEKTISITTPVRLKIQRVYWGAPGGALMDLPCAINTISYTDASPTTGWREDRFRINVQIAVARMEADDQQARLAALNFFWAAKDAFDKDLNLGLGSELAIRFAGLDPTAPVRLEHAGQAYVGVNAVLDLHIVELIQ